jgi:hypothetical protein
MNATFFLLVVSAIVGLVSGFYFSWIAVLISAFALAFLSATVLQIEGFGSLAGITIIVVCLTVNQICYRIGMMLAARGRRDR